MEVTVGPKSFLSDLPMGKVDLVVYAQIEAADRGALGRQIYNFNLLTKRLSPSTSEYMRAHVLNGHCRYKKYNLVDVLKYKIGRLFK